jgi:hypothetical protein
MVSRLASLPAEELKSSLYSVSTNSRLVAKKLYLKLTTRVNWPTGKPGNWVTK